jgi:hypothetical protein
MQNRLFLPFGKGRGTNQYTSAPNTQVRRISPIYPYAAEHGQWPLPRMATTAGRGDQTSRVRLNER